MRPESPPRGVGARTGRTARWQERFVLGAMLAVALFCFEAGLGHIGLARDEACRAVVASVRIAPAAGAGCLTELEQAVTRALASGPAGAIFRENLTVVSWLLSGLLYGGLGGLCAQLNLGRGVLIYLGVHAFVFIGITFVLYIGPHVVA